MRDEKKAMAKKSKKKRGKKKAKTKKTKEPVAAASQAVQERSRKSDDNAKENSTGDVLQQKSNSIQPIERALSAEGVAIGTAAQQVFNGSLGRTDATSEDGSMHAEKQLDLDPNNTRSRKAEIGHQTTECKDEIRKLNQGEEVEDLKLVTETKTPATQLNAVDFSHLEPNRETGVATSRSTPSPPKQRESSGDITSLDKAVVADYFTSTVDGLHVQALPLGKTCVV